MTKKKKEKEAPQFQDGQVVLLPAGVGAGVVVGQSGDTVRLRADYVSEKREVEADATDVADAQ